MEAKTDAPVRLLASYGRRRGRPLRVTRQHLVDTLLPRISIELEDGKKLDPKTLIPNTQQLWLEIGFGGGEHLAAQAMAHPYAGIIGCEPYINGMASLLAKLDGDKVENVRIHSHDARPLMDALPDASLDRVFILYADPWPKARHHKRRLISQPFLDSLARIMKQGSLLRLATDDPPYGEWMIEHLHATPHFSFSAKTLDECRTPPEGWVPTRYEGKAKAAGRVPAYFDAIRR